MDSFFVVSRHISNFNFIHTLQLASIVQCKFQKSTTNIQILFSLEQREFTFGSQLQAQQCESRS